MIKKYMKVNNQFIRTSLMPPHCSTGVVAVLHDIARHRHAAVEDVLDGDPCGDTTPSYSNNDENGTVNSLPFC